VRLAAGNKRMPVVSRSSLKVIVGLQAAQLAVQPCKERLELVPRRSFQLPLRDGLAAAQVVVGRPGGAQEGLAAAARHTEEAACLCARLQVGLVRLERSGRTASKMGGRENRRGMLLGHCSKARQTDGNGAGKEAKSRGG
jgi:hypothetical protein